MFDIQRTAEFATWFENLKDRQGKARILTRLTAASLGNFGDHKSVGGGVWEMRVDVGPGYRVYYVQIGSVTYLLLCGGDKSSQNKDILRAQQMVDTLKQTEKNKSKKKEDK